MDAEHADELVNAEVVLGNDGLAHAVRFIHRGSNGRGAERQ
jgi:hypothetical protein